MFDHVNVDDMCTSFEDELKKIVLAKQASVGKVVAPMVAGAAVYEALRRANHDRKLGKQVRTQQGY